MTDLGLPGGSDGKESAAMWEAQVRSLGQEDPLEKGMAIHFSILAWRIPLTQLFFYLISGKLLSV